MRLDSRFGPFLYDPTLASPSTNMNCLHANFLFLEIHGYAYLNPLGSNVINEPTKGSCFMSSVSRSEQSEARGQL